MTVIERDNTSSFDGDAADLASENRKIEILNDDSAARRPDIDNSSPVVPEQKEEVAKPIDPRKARMDEIAARSNERRREELEATNATFNKPVVADPTPVLGDDDHVDLKVRKQTQRMTVKERNEILLDDFDGDDIQGMTEADRNRNAQMILANRSYRAELDELKREAKTSPQPQIIHQPQQPVQVEPQKTAREIAEEKLDKALEALEFGQPDARVAVKEAQNELARVAAEEVVLERDQRHRESVIDRDFFEGRDSVLREYASDPITAGALNAAIDIGLKAVIAQTIGSLPQDTQNMFLQNGITPDYLGNASTKEVTDLYKDMILKGYQIHQPSKVIRVVAENATSKLAGITRPAPQDQHLDPAGPDGQNVGLDRSARKEAIANQPSRAALPRTPSNATPQPLSEQERAKATRDTERMKRRGVPVR